MDNSSGNDAAPRTGQVANIATVLSEFITIDTIAGPWFSLGLHIDFQHRYIDIHFIWWIITVGAYKAYMDDNAPKEVTIECGGYSYSVILEEGSMTWCVAETLTENALNDKSDVALGMYAGEPCRICGEIIQRNDLSEAVFSGYSAGNKARAAHGDCWKLNKPKAKWAYPIDARSDD